MIKKYLAATAAAVVSVVLTGCGPLVQQAEYASEISVSEIPEELFTVTPEETSASDDVSENAAVSSEPDVMPIEMYEGYELSESCLLDVECIMQKPELPTGCEVTSLAIALNYNGFDISHVELCDEFLFKDYWAYYTFEEAYVGDPKSNNGYGCYAPVIVETADKFFESVGSDWYGYDLSGTYFRDLFYQIDQGRPVIVWASMDMRDTEMTFRWATEDGDEAWFADFEHCMVLTGYDLSQDTVYAADPLNGNVKYSLERFEECYEMLWKRAVVLCSGELNADVNINVYDNTYDSESAPW